ncbi:MAG: hypothetical protein V1916_00050 [Patescibacteria group bacterium]
MSRLQENGKRKVFLFLIVLAVVVVPLSFWQLQHQLKDSLKLPAARLAENANAIARATNTNAAAVAPLTDLKGKDTDKDGLSDYDELYVRRTSPYLADSDSDGTSDQQEIDSATDPNCPKDQNCGRIEPDTNANTNASAGTNAAAGNTNTQTVDVANLQPADLRQIMVDAGAPVDQVDKISDADLLQTYRDLLATEGSALAANTNGTSQSVSTTTPVVNINTGVNYGTLTYDQLYALQPAEIRQLLQEGGVPKETLDTMDDATLQQVYRESLLQNVGSQTPSQ